jgi:hypothetical protein
MTESHAKRPPLATIICIYLVVTVLIPLQVMGILLWGWFHSVFNFPPILLPRSPLLLVIWTLAIAGTVALWLMRRAAFFLLAARFALSLTILVIDLPRRMAFLHRMSVTMPRAVAVSAIRASIASTATEWLVGALIVWYVYRITSPRQFSAESAGSELIT